MTPDEQSVLEIIRQLNASDFSGWFAPSSVMAFVQIESAFKQFARRYEPALNDASYGYMQLLSSTAHSIGYQGPVFPHMPDPPYTATSVAGSLYESELNLKLGMTYLKQNWDVLEKRLGREPTPAQWADSYNRGPAGQNLGSPTHAYPALWASAKVHWQAQGADDT